jgi:hypothetical protein
MNLLDTATNLESAKAILWDNYLCQTSFLFILLAGLHSPGTQPFPVMPDEKFNILPGFGAAVCENLPD